MLTRRMMLQIESRAGLEAINEICQVAGVDGILVGPSDLAAVWAGWVSVPQ